MESNQISSTTLNQTAKLANPHQSASISHNCTSLWFAHQRTNSFEQTSRNFKALVLLPPSKTHIELRPSHDFAPPPQPLRATVQPPRPPGLPQSQWLLRLLGLQWAALGLPQFALPRLPQFALQGLPQFAPPGLPQFAPPEPQFAPPGLPQWAVSGLLQWALPE